MFAICCIGCKIWKKNLHASWGNMYNFFHSTQELFKTISCALLLCLLGGGAKMIPLSSAPTPGSGEFVPPCRRCLFAQEPEPPWQGRCLRLGLRFRLGLHEGYLEVLQLEVEFFDDGAWNQKTKILLNKKCCSTKNCSSFGWTEYAGQNHCVNFL